MRERSGRLRFNILLSAEVVEWQTRTFEGRVAQAVRVQVPPSAPRFFSGRSPAKRTESLSPCRRGLPSRWKIEPIAPFTLP
jgi:hypothetical protein